MNNTETIKVTLVKSLIGCIKAHKACASGLGLRRIGQTITVKPTKENLGMLNKINYMIRYEG